MTSYQEIRKAIAAMKDKAPEWRPIEIAHSTQGRPCLTPSEIGELTAKKVPELTRTRRVKVGKTTLVLRWDRVLMRPTKTYWGYNWSGIETHWRIDQDPEWYEFKGWAQIERELQERNGLEVRQPKAGNPFGNALNEQAFRALEKHYSALEHVGLQLAIGKEWVATCGYGPSKPGQRKAALALIKQGMLDMTHYFWEGSEDLPVDWDKLAERFWIDYQDKYEL